MRRTPDVYLSRKALATWPLAMVWRDERGRFFLSILVSEEGRSKERTVCLADDTVPTGKRFNTARDALKLLRKRAAAGLELFPEGGAK